MIGNNRQHRKIVLVLAEKPSVGRELARVLGCRQKANGYIEGPSYIVTWALGHLVELAPPEKYGKQYQNWSMETLPMLPDKMQLLNRFVCLGRNPKTFDGTAESCFVQNPAGNQFSFPSGVTLEGAFSFTSGVPLEELV